MQVLVQRTGAEGCESSVFLNQLTLKIISAATGSFRPFWALIPIYERIWKKFAALVCAIILVQTKFGLMA